MSMCSISRKVVGVSQLLIGIVSFELSFFLSSVCETFCALNLISSFVPPLVTFVLLSPMFNELSTPSWLSSLVSGRKGVESLEASLAFCFLYERCLEFVERFDFGFGSLNVNILLAATVGLKCFGPALSSYLICSFVRPGLASLSSAFF